MARKLGQITARGQSTWLVRVYLGRDPETRTRKYHNQTIHGPFREAQRFLNLKLQLRENGRVSRAAVMSLNQFLDQWLTTVVKARVRASTFRNYETLLRLHIRPVLGSRLIGTISQIDIQILYAQMFARGLSARTIEYTNAVLKSAFSQAVRWKLLAEDRVVHVFGPGGHPNLAAQGIFYRTSAASCILASSEISRVRRAFGGCWLVDIEYPHLRFQGAEFPLNGSKLFVGFPQFQEPGIMRMIESNSWCPQSNRRRDGSGYSQRSRTSELC
jgi:hypothetical protein